MTEACGTYREYQAHRRRGEEPCPACRRANSAYMAGWRKRRPDLAAENAAGDAARDRALRRLGRRHPGELAALYGEELAAGRMRQGQAS